MIIIFTFLKYFNRTLVKNNAYSVKNVTPNQNLNEWIVKREYVKFYKRAKKRVSLTIFREIILTNCKT